MGRRPWLRIRYLSDVLVLVNGPGAGKLLIEAGGKPLWSRRHHGWATTRRYAAEVEARAREARYRVFVVLDYSQPTLLDVDQKSSTALTTSSSAAQLDLGLEGAP
jgi:hypothetical protein